MKLSIKEVARPTLVLFLICAVVSVLLGVTNLLTEDRIAEAQAKIEQDSRQVVLPEAEMFEPGEQKQYYIGKKGSEVLGYVFVTESKGYGGTVRVMTGIGADGSIKGIVILSQSETPGLGANAVKSSFTDRFKQPAQELEVVKNQPSGGGKIEAMTGASITSRAVTAAVNQAVELNETVKGGE